MTTPIALTVRTGVVIAGVKARVLIETVVKGQSVLLQWWCSTCKRV